MARSLPRIEGLWITRCQLEAAAAGADELLAEPLDALDVSEELDLVGELPDELVDEDSELLELLELLELFFLFSASRLSVR